MGRWAYAGRQPTRELHKHKRKEQKLHPDDAPDVTRLLSLLQEESLVLSRLLVQQNGGHPTNGTGALIPQAPRGLGPGATGASDAQHPRLWL
ncbi:hypothetical protein NDU88_008386 [Pleurodeles waltl]|uniref:Uncharacterized protein n=1 Tax=Pleurodeles waltl TaxID=8319 RepID=A0AAV7NZ70_PLEWA|nr:hypothetical protein NDU88_008386 [Pleurodeles waltl]